MSSAGVMELCSRAGSALLQVYVPLTLACGLILVAALVLDRALQGRVSAGVRLWLYLPIVIRLALPADFSSALGLLGLGGSSGGEITLGAASVQLAGAAPAAGAAGAGWPALVLAGYLAGALALLGRWLMAARRLRRDLHEASGVGAIVGEMAGAAAGTDRWWRARVQRHPQLGPAVVGLLRPRVVLPASLLEGGDAQAIDLVLRHEVAHIRRGDHLLAAALHLANILAWPLLPVWLAARRIRLLMEHACDERALRGEQPPVVRRYGELLLALAEGQRGPGWSSPIPAFGSPLAGRLRALGRRRRWPLLLQLLPVLAGGALALACSGAPEEAAVPATGPAPGATATAAPATETPASTAARESNDQPGTAVIRGSLDKMVIRDVIRSHIGAVKHCYETALEQLPGLGGRITVQFTIAADGRVVSSVLETSTMANARVESCVVQEVRGWKFPEPAGGGIVVVSYPFSFTPSGRAPGAAQTPDPGQSRWKFTSQMHGLKSRMDMPQATTPMQKEVLSALAGSAQQAMKSCYDAAFARQNTPDARLDIRVMVGTDGKVSQVKFHGPVGSNITGCLDRALAGRQLSVRPKETVWVSFPMIMSNTGGR